jgi:hypothetical protein
MLILVCSRQGEMDVHARDYISSMNTINWGTNDLYRGTEFNENGGIRFMAVNRKNIFI